MKNKKVLRAFGMALVMAMTMTACGSLTDSDTVGSAAVAQNDDATANSDAKENGTAAAATGDLLCLVGGEHTYTIIYDKDFGEKAVSACKELKEYLGGTITLADDQNKDGEATASGEYEILLGVTDRPESIALAEGLGMFDYRIAIQGEKLFIVGGSDDAFINAVAHLIRSDDSIAEGTIPRDYNVYFDGADNRDEYIANPDLFLCNWALKFDVPEWMTDFEEKVAALADTDGRMMSSVHRGDAINYPENSIEAVISAIKMGIDNIEIDLRVTRDGVVVLMHDETLEDTTDFREKAGQNGLPESNKVSDWTLEELRQLRLLGTDGEKTDYLIPTLKEALQVCNERSTLRLDKIESWDWDTDIYPLIKETGAWRTCILHQQFSFEQRKEILDTIKTDSGKDGFMFYSFKHDDRESWETKWSLLAEQGYQPIVHYARFKIRTASRYVQEAEPYLNQIKDKTRIYVDANILSGGDEKAKTFGYLYESGIDFVLVDNGLGVQQYIAENFVATEY